MRRIGLDYFGSREEIYRNILHKCYNICNPDCQISIEPFVILEREKAKDTKREAWYRKKLNVWRLDIAQKKFGLNRFSWASSLIMPDEVFEFLIVYASLI